MDSNIRLPIWTIFILFYFCSAQHVSLTSLSTVNEKNAPKIFQMLDIRSVEKHKIFGLPVNGEDNNDKHFSLKNEKYDHGLWFESQLLDHFDSSNKATFKQKYYVTMKHFDNSSSSSSPIFLMLGQNYILSSAWEKHNLIADYSKQFKAALVLLEHRYYGFSQPTRLEF